MPKLRNRSLVLASLALAGCAGQQEHHYFHKTEQPHAAEWGDEGDVGPTHWAELSPDYALAASGRRQSPIDIRDAVEQPLAPVELDYHPAKIELVYNGHTVEEMADRKSHAVVEGKRYGLEQFHFHAPSEHTVEGRHTDMEMHLVHKAGDGSVLVVAVMLQAGGDNPAFRPVWDHMPSDADRERESSATIDAARLLPDDRSYYRYSGSFTTPPCTEDVLWIVLRTPVEISRAQIDAFRAVIDRNNRPVQPRNGREIARSR